MSSTPVRRTLLSAVTLFGGHFLNRRLDRVALIGVLLVVAVIASIGAVRALPDVDAANFYFAATWVSRLPLILVVAIAGLSAALTFRDARRLSDGSPTILVRITRLPLTVLGALVLPAAFLVAGISLGTWSYLQDEFTVATAGHLYFGHGDRAIAIGYQLPPPEDGPYPLRGRITLDKAGIDGARITLMINDKYDAVVYSDSRGEFEVSLPAGKWHINEITVSDWGERPRNRNLILFSSHEALKRAGLYSRFNFDLADGLEVSLPAGPNAVPIELEFRDPIPLTWPSLPGPGGVPETELSNAAIAWQPVKGASEYEVQVTHVSGDGAVRLPLHILTRRVSGLTLPLASLPQRTATVPADQYSVHVFAFDAAGRLLTESGLEFDDRMFRLTGEARLGREQQYVGFWGPAQVISAEYERNEERLEKVSNLLEVKRLDEARNALDEVTNDAPRGRASALRGRIAALQGDCATALKLFDKADAEAGGDCASREYRPLCEVSER